jgi:hypothetical protein
MSGKDIRDRFYSPTPRRVKNALLAFKGFIGSISISAIIQEDPYWACGFLIAGAFIELVVNIMFVEGEM